MRSLEELASSIRIRATRVQFEEAFRSFSAGAYRSATVALWICLLLDLVEKLKILADSGDGAAGALVAEVAAAREAGDIQKMLSLEGSLLARAHTEFELITMQEKAGLERLREDRNACAHPSFYGEGEDIHAMSPELVRAHMTLVVDAVLSQPPVVGKALVDRFIADTKGMSWPVDGLADYLRDRYFNRARANGIRNILRVAVKAAIRPPDADNLIAGRCVATVGAAAEIDHPRVVEAITDILNLWRDALSEDDLLRVVGAVGTFPETWQALGPENVTRARVLLETADADTLVEQRVFASGPPSDSRVADKYQIAVSGLEVAHLDILTRKPYPKRQWVGQIIRAVDSARSYRTAEEAMRMVLRVAEFLDLDDIRHLSAEFVRNDQINHASDMPQIMSRLVEATQQPGSREAWVSMITEYRDTRNIPVTDSAGYYSYEDLLTELHPTA